DSLDASDGIASHVHGDAPYPAPHAAHRGRGTRTHQTAERLPDERAASNAISRIRFALTDSQEQTLTTSEAAAIHAILATWLTEDAPEEATTRARLEKLERATSPI